MAKKIKAKKITAHQISEADLIALLEQTYEVKLSRCNHPYNALEHNNTLLCIPLAKYDPITEPFVIDGIAEAIAKLRGDHEIGWLLNTLLKDMTQKELLPEGMLIVDGMW
jgi:hypothetical protein